MGKLIQWLAFHLAARRGRNRVHPRASIKNPARLRLDGGVKILAMAAVDAGKSGPGVWLGSGVTLNPYAQIQAGAGGIRIGPGSEVNNFSFIHGGGGVEIGRDVLIGPHVVIVTENHAYADPRVPIRLQRGAGEKVVIGDDVWIGASAVILPGVSIGRGSIVAAGAVVSRSCAPGSILAGVPAACRGQRPGFTAGPGAA